MIARRLPVIGQISRASSYDCVTQRRERERERERATEQEVRERSKDEHGGEIADRIWVNGERVWLVAATHTGAAASAERAILERASERASEASASATFLPLVSVPVPIVRHSCRLPEDEAFGDRVPLPPLFFFLLVPLVSTRVSNGTMIV